MIVSIENGDRGVLIDEITGSPIPAKWANLETGEYVKFELDCNGQTINGENGFPLVTKGITKLKWIPRKPSPAISDTPHSLKEHIKQVQRKDTPLYASGVPCMQYGCVRSADWMVADQTEIHPYVQDGVPYSSGVITGTRYYCSWHYKPPRTLDEKGEVVSVWEDAGGARPKWDS